MRIAVVTYGTEGDARPLAALCRALDDAGHSSVFLADASTLGTARKLGVRSQALDAIGFAFGADDGRLSRSGGH